MEPNFRTPAIHARNGDRIYRGLFAESPNPYLLLTPDLMIINGNDAYLAVTGTSRDELANRFLFDVFPDNPHDPHATGVRNLTESFARVLQQRCRDAIALQRYDICHAGVWQMHYWYPINWPILDDDDRIIALVHHTKEATVPASIGDPVAQAHHILQTTAAIAESLQGVVERLTGRL